MIRGMVTALVFTALASPAMAAPPTPSCETKLPLCQVKKDRAGNPDQRRTVKQEACVKRYALM